MNIHEMVSNGIPLKDILVIDAHCHMGFIHNYSVFGGSAQSIIDNMDHIGIDVACISHNAALTPDHKWGNDRIIEAVQKFPGRFIGYCTINPHYPEEIPAELERCSKIKGMKGIKIIPWLHERTMDYKNYKIVYEFAAKHKYHVLVHVYSREEVDNMDRFASEYPDAVFLMGHTGGEVVHIERAVDVINRHDNIYADFTGSLAKEGEIEWLAGEVGSKKMLFGSDLPHFCSRATIGRVSSAEISEEEKRDILGLNMKHILKI